MEMGRLFLHISLTTNTPLHLWKIRLTAVVNVTNKASMTKTVERFPIYKLTRLDNQISEKCTVKYNALLNTIIHKNSYREHSPP